MTEEFAVCPTCRGKGTHVNPSIDAHGITSEEMDDLGDDFREDYISGHYDVLCAECNGLRVVAKCYQDDCPNPAEYRTRGYGDRRDRVSTEHYRGCWEHLHPDDRETEDSLAEMYATQAAEQRMGA